MRDTNFILQPPSVPMFLYKSHAGTWREHIKWARKEFQARIRYLAEHGEWKLLKWMNENSSPIRVLAELPDYPKMCAKLDDGAWNRLSREEREFITGAYELRAMLQ